jgi:tetracycline repressor-like protein
MFEFVLEASREPSLRTEVERWEAAHLRLAEAGLRAAGSDDPETDARLVVATITGLMLEQVAAPNPQFERTILRPALERLFTRLAPE